MRADVYLAATGRTKSRKKAQDLIAAGAVRIDGAMVKKSSENVDESVPHQIEIEEIFKYVSRGGMKLEAALDFFSVKVGGKKAVDVGSSTGGFTDCLLQRGIRQVICVDSGVGQLHESLRENPRVTVREQFNARLLDDSVTDGPCDLGVMDVSFISQTYLLPQVASVLREGGELITLIKPQFEAGRSALGKNGVVHSGAYRYLAVKRVLESAILCGLDPVGLIPSPIEGGDGNREYLAYFLKRPCIVPRIEDKTIRRITSAG